MKNIHLIIALLLCQWIAAQQVFVPYRVKDKWGLSDVNGKLAVDAVYDKVFIGRSLADGYYGFRKGDALGIIHNKKEIISGPYREFDVVENKFIIAQSKSDFTTNNFNTQAEYEEARKKRDARFLFNLSGKNLHPEGFRNARVFDSIGSSSKLKGHAKYLLFISENFERQKSVFVYDIDKQDVTQWLLKDYYKLNLVGEGEFANAKYYIQGHEIGTADEMIYTFSIAKNKVSINSRPAPKPKYSGGYGTGGGSGSDGISAGSYDGDLSVEAAPSTGKKTYTTSIAVNGNAIRFKSTEYPRKMTSTEGIVEKDIVLPYEMEWLKGERLYHTLIRPNGERVSLNGAAYFKTKQGNYGVVFLDTLMIKPVYTYLQPFISYSTPENRMLFFAGKRDENNGRMKYGMIDIFQKEVIPVVYDSIFYDEKIRDRESFVRTLAVRRLNVVKEGKYGIMDISGQTVLKPVYDSIYQNKKNYMQFSATNFNVLSKDGKYGLHSEYVKDALLIEPVWTKPPSYYIYNYQGQKGLMLFGLTDAEGELFCYARKDGFLYYRE